MRIGLVIYGSLQTLSGGYLYDRKLVEVLRANGDEVEIISLPCSTYPRHLLHNFSCSLLQHLVQLHFDVLIQDELNHPSLFLLNRFLKRRAGYPVVSIVHNLRSRGQCSPLLRPLYRKIEQYYLKSVDDFIFNSLTTKASTQECLGAELNGIVAYPAGDRLGPGLNEEVIIRGCHLNSPPRIAFVGNLNPGKNLGGLLLSLSKLRDEPWELSVAGLLTVNPDYTRKMLRMAASLGLGEKVKFLGPLTEAPLAKLYNDSHILALPFSNEGFGIVYLEGMCFGLPSLGSTQGAAREIISDGRSGFLIDPGDVDGLTQTLYRLMTNRDELLCLSLNARKRFNDFPAWEQTGMKIRSFLHVLTSTR